MISHSFSARYDLIHNIFRDGSYFFNSRYIRVAIGKGYAYTNSHYMDKWAHHKSTNPHVTQTEYKWLKRSFALTEIISLNRF